MGCYALLQGIFPTQGLNPGLLDCRQILYHLSQQEAHPYAISSVQFSHSIVSDSFWTHGLQHDRIPCPSPTPGVYSCPLSLSCHPTISSSVVPFSSCLQCFPASWSFPMNQFFSSGGQSIGAAASVLPMNSQDWFPLGWAGLISLLSKGLSRLNVKWTLNSWSKSHLLWMLYVFLYIAKVYFRTFASMLMMTTDM